MDNKKRVPIRCWSCGRTYSLLLEFAGRPTLNLACPFCAQPNIVDLDPFRSPVRDIHAGEEAPPLTLDSLNLPDVLPSRPPRPDEEVD